MPPMQTYNSNAFVRFVLKEDTEVVPHGLYWQPDRSRGVQSPITIIKKRQVQQDSKFINFTAGAVSGLVADAVTHPIDTIR